MLAVEKIVEKALREDYLVEVDYVSTRGLHTRRVMEPLSFVHDYARRKHIFYGRCLEHNRTEPRRCARIEDIRLVEIHTGEAKVSRARRAGSAYRK